MNIHSEKWLTRAHSQQFHFLIKLQVFCSASGLITIKAKAFADVTECKTKKQHNHRRKCAFLQCGAISLMRISPATVMSGKRCALIAFFRRSREFLLSYDLVAFAARRLSHILCPVSDAGTLQLLRMERAEKEKLNSPLFSILLCTP